MPQFSIVTVTKNNSDGLARTKQSIKAQNFVDYEWIVIDGEVEPDKGIYDAMNKGVARAKGDYMIFMNAGDCFSAPDNLNMIARLCPTDFIYADAVEDGYRKQARTCSRLSAGMFTHHQSMVFRRSVIGSLRYDMDYPIAADYKFIAQYLKKCDSVIYAPVALCDFEGGGLSHKYTRQGRQEQSDIRRQLGIKEHKITRIRQILAGILRRFFPRCYWFLRSAIV